MTQKTRTQILTEINDMLTTNSSGLITGAMLNTLAKNLNDSFVNILSDALKLGLKPFSATYNYQIDDTFIYNNRVYKVTTAGAGVFSLARVEIALDLNADALTALLTGLVTTDDSDLDPTDTLLEALGKLQAQAKRKTVKRVLFSNVPLSVTGTTAETVIFSGAIQPGDLGENGVLTFEMMFAGVGSAGTKTTRLKVNGVTVNTIAHGSNTQFIKMSVPMINRNAYNSQFLPPTNDLPGVGFGVSSTSGGSSATIDTTAVLSVEITIQNASAADIFRLETLNVNATY